MGWTDGIPEAEMIAAVKAHALEHYEQNGWDTVVECWADDEIAEVIKDCETNDEAIEEIAPFAAYREDIQGYAF